MPIEIRELVIRTTVTRSDADATSVEALDQPATDDNGESTAIMQSAGAITNGEATSDFLADRHIEMPCDLKLEGVQADFPAPGLSEDTLEFDLGGTDLGELDAGAGGPIDFTWMNDEPVGSTDDPGGGFVTPDLSPAGLEAADCSGDTLVHEVGHWLG